MALLPLALVLGEVTEDLAIRFGDVIGGLLNATFGNVVELILSVAALTKGLYTVVAMSLIGSVLSNLLLVMGAAPACLGGSGLHMPCMQVAALWGCHGRMFEVASTTAVVQNTVPLHPKPKAFSHHLPTQQHQAETVLFALAACSHAHLASGSICR